MLRTELQGSPVSSLHNGLCALRKKWCGRRESNPHRPFEPCGFSYRPRLSPPGCSSHLDIRFAVWTIPSPSPDHLRLRCRPSSLYTFPANFWPGLARDCHIIEVSPTLSSSASPVSRASTQVFLKSAASAIPPRPRGGLTAFLS